jgi:hypothetical protein
MKPYLVAGLGPSIHAMKLVGEFDTEQSARDAAFAHATSFRRSTAVYFSVAVCNPVDAPSEWIETTTAQEGKPA